jgi:hypothetical protein
VFWTWVIGPLGALLAVPLTLLARALLIETNPRFRVVGTAADRRQAEPTDDLLQKWGVACLVRPLLRRTPR